MIEMAKSDFEGNRNLVAGYGSLGPRGEIRIAYAANQDTVVYVIRVTKPGAYARIIAQVQLCKVSTKPKLIKTDSLFDHLDRAAVIAAKGSCEADSSPDPKTISYETKFHENIDGEYVLTKSQSVSGSGYKHNQLKLIESLGKHLSPMDALKSVTINDPIRQIISYPGSANWTGHVVLESGSLIQYKVRAHEVQFAVCLLTGDGLPLALTRTDPATELCSDWNLEVKEIRMKRLEEYIRKNQITTRATSD